MFNGWHASEFPEMFVEKTNSFLDSLAAILSQDIWGLIFFPPFKCVLKRPSLQMAYLSSGLRKT